ncbi:TPA: hypothetical protein DGH83_00865 [Candidatus Peregrinibacteria bacterium]|nr:hypothetical protein [Candidatus Peregrinibacteria bacterium]
MSILAIDVGKEKLALRYGDNPEKSQYIEIENHPRALKEILSTWALSPQNTRVIMESTGDYHYTPAQFFLQNKFPVRLLNPILTNVYTKASIRKLKTDRVDTVKIMELGLKGEGEDLNLESFINPKKELLRLSHFLTQLRSQLKLKTQSLERKNILGSESIQELLTLIDQMSESIERIDSSALKEIDEQAKKIDSIPGFSIKLSQVIATECGDIKRFKEASSLVAYAGLDPKIIQSGRMNHRGKLTKCGSPFLRYALFLAARTAWRYDPDLFAYYQKKRGEGRSFTEVMCMISRKLLHRIYAVVSQNRLYQVNPISS